MTQLILDQALQQPTKLNVKIDFLQHQKDNLQQSVRELCDNIKMYKNMIQQLTQKHQKLMGRQQLVMSGMVRDLNVLNDRHAARIETLMEEVKSLKCTILLKEQILEEQEMESQTVLKGYEDKILELRRAIQDKEFAIQEKQNPRTRADANGKKDYIMDPKQEAMKLNTELEELKELVRKLNLDNNELRKKNKEMTEQTSQQVYKIDKMQALLNSNVCFHTARNLYKADKSRMSQNKVCFKKPVFSPPPGRRSIQKVDLSKQQTNFSKKRSKVSSNYSESYYIKNQALAYMRQLLFKQKKTTEQLTKALTQLNQSYQALVNSNRLLTQSNINYQMKRTNLQSQVNLYKKKNQQLLSIIMKKKIKLNRSFGQLPTDQLLLSLKPEPQIQHNDRQINKCLATMRDQTDFAMKQFSRAMTRGFLTRFSKRDNRVSYSCPTDYVPKQEVNPVEQLIKKQQAIKFGKKQEREENNPFMIDVSMIRPDQKPMTFGEYAMKKRKIITESFFQISEEILKH